MSVQAISWALSVRGISPRAKLVLLSLANSADEATWTCFPARRTLAAAADCSTDTVDRCLRELVDAGLVEKQPRSRDGRGQTSNGYALEGGRKIAAPPLKDAAPPAEEVRPPQPHSSAAGPAASGAAPYEPSLNHHLSTDAADACAREGPTLDVWPERLRQAQARAGDALDRTQGSVHHYADLKALCEPTRGDPCDWDDDVLPAIDATAASCRARGKLIRSWTWVREAALAIRTRRLAGNPEMTYEQPRAYSPPHAGADRSRARSFASIGLQLAAEARAAERRQRGGDDRWDADPLGDFGGVAAVRPRLSAC